jgi:Mg2+ and Co2+ transporter CorA
MAKDKGSNVDAEVRLELAEFKNEIHTTIIDSISNGFKEVEKHLTELFNKDIENIKDTQKRYAKHHEEHFSNIDKLRDYVDAKLKSLEDDKLKSLEDRIVEVRNNQLACKAKEQVTDKIEEKTDRKKNTNYGFIVMLCTIFMVLGVVVGFII